MEKLDVVKLDEALTKIIITNNQVNRLTLKKDKKEKDRLESQITYLKNKMVTDFNLMQYDLHVKMEMHNTNFFITDVEDIIRNNSEENNA